MACRPTLTTRRPAADAPTVVDNVSMRFDVITIFPGIFSGLLDFGMPRRARADGAASVHLHDLRTWTSDRHRTVDDRPYGGGEGMVLKPEPLAAAIESLDVAPLPSRDLTRESVILLSPQGLPYVQRTAEVLATLDRIVLICGRYEGVDERVNQLFCDRELSVGDFVLSGGELAAALVIDSVVRLLPGVLGNPDSTRHESFGSGGQPSCPLVPGAPPRSTQGAGGLLDYPHYTRPQQFRGLSVPDPLVGGDHDAVRRWRRQSSLAKTARNRPELLRTADLSSEDRELLRTAGGVPGEPHAPGGTKPAP